MRFGFDLPPDDAIAKSPVLAARALMDVFLQELPEDASDAPAWTAALARVETAMQLSVERAVSVVTAWRDVSAAVVESVQETRGQFIFARDGEPGNPLWLRPEWIGFAPRFHRFWRRRRDVRRRLTDPDYAPGILDDGEAR